MIDPTAGGIITPQLGAYLAIRSALIDDAEYMVTVLEGAMTDGRWNTSHVPSNVSEHMARIRQGFKLLDEAIAEIVLLAEDEIMRGALQEIWEMSRDPDEDQMKLKEVFGIVDEAVAKLDAMAQARQEAALPEQGDEQ